MRTSRISFLVLLLVAGLLAALPGVAEGIEAVIPGDDCTDDCPADTADGRCGSSCDECTCCARSMSAVFAACSGLGKPRHFETASSAFSTRTPLVISKGVYHPPRA